MKMLFWAGYWLFVAFAILVALDNLVFQPPMPGWIIGGFLLSSIAYVLVRTKILVNREGK